MAERYSFIFNRFYRTAIINNMDYILEWHHLHIWPISTTENAATLHIVINSMNVMHDVKQNLKKIFANNGISHCTIECELPNEYCDDRECCT